MKKYEIWNNVHKCTPKRTCLWCIPRPPFHFHTGIGLHKTPAKMPLKRSQKNLNTGLSTTLWLWGFKPASSMGPNHSSVRRRGYLKYTRRAYQSITNVTTYLSHWEGRSIIMYYVRCNTISPLNKHSWMEQVLCSLVKKISYWRMAMGFIPHSLTHWFSIVHDLSVDQS